MLGLSWGIARSGIAATSERLSVVSSNVTRAGDVDAARKIVEQSSVFGGGVRIASIGRVESQAIRDAYLLASSQGESSRVIAGALEDISASVMDPGLGGSPSAALGRLEAALRFYATTPADEAAGRSVVAAARDLAGSIGEADRIVAGVRSAADRDIGRAVGTLNGLLSDLQNVNQAILRDSDSGIDLTDKLDDRDRLLNGISEIVGIRVVPRGARDIVVYTDAGHVLFEQTARSVSAATSPPLAPGVEGGAILIDGVAVAGGGAGSGIRSGTLNGLVKVRDEVTVVAHAQLDEMARGLIEAFADPDRSGGGLPSLPGLFTSPAGGVPATGVVVHGLARQLAVNPAIDPAQGGSLRYLRDGGASAPGDPAYNANASGAAGFSARIDELVGALTAARPFASDTELATSQSLAPFAAASSGWIESSRKDYAGEFDLRSALRDRAHERLSGATGINLDQEMTDMLQLERSFEASSRLLATIDQLLRSLISELR